MSILNVNKINPVGGGSTITIAGIASVTNNLTSGNISAASSVTATTYYGDGSNLTGIDAGNLTGTVADARITTLTASKLSGALPAISGANLTGISGGKILQVQSTTRTDTFSASIGKNTFSGAAISVSITPASASNKILILANLTIGLQSDNDVGFGIFKDGSVIQAATGDANGSAQRIHAQSFNQHYEHQNNVNGMFLDTAGGTSAITYDCRLCHGNNSTSGHTVYLNRDHSYHNQTQHQYSRSCITVMEVEA